MSIKFLSSQDISGTLTVSGTSTFSKQLTVSSSVGGDGSWTGGILIENTSTNTGEPALAFKNAGSGGTGTNYWFTGLNQNSTYKIAYGTGFTGTNTKLELTPTGLFKLNAYGAGTLVSDASGNITSTSTPPGTGTFLPLSAGGSFPLTGALNINLGSNDVATIKLRRDTAGDNQIVGDIEFDTTAAQGGDDRIALIRATTSGGDGTGRGGAMLLYTRQSGSANFNTTTYDKDGNWTFPSNGNFAADVSAVRANFGSASLANILTVSSSQGSRNTRFLSAGNGGYVQFESANDGIYGYLGTGSHLLSPVVNDNDFVIRAEKEFAVSIVAAEKFRINASGNATFAGDVTVSGGDITLGGTGRIQGVDTVSASTDAANKAYVDSAISGTGTVTGTGVLSQVAVWTGSTSITNGPITFAASNNATFTGSVAVTGGTLALGSDVSIFRDGANVLRTDDKLHANNDIYLGGAGKIFDRANNSNYIELADTIVVSTALKVGSDITVAGGNITLQGTGRIQGIDTVSASTDAANKAYVDANSSSLSGSGAGGRVTIWSGTNILSSDTQLLFDTSTNKLTSTLFQIPNNGDYLGTDTGGSARTLISLTSGNDVEVSNSALTTGSDTIIYFGDNFRVKDGSTNRLSISSNGTMSNFGNTFNSGPINLDEGNKIVFDVDGDQWNYIYANGGSTDMAVGGTLTLLNIEENLFGDIKLENIYSIINGSTSSNATFIPVYTDSASSTVPRLLREQTPTQFLSNAGAITGSGTSGRVAFFTGTRTQASDTLYWNSTQNALGINVNPTSSTAGHLQMPGTTNSGGKSIFINTTLSSTYGALGIDVKTPRYGSAIQLTSNQTSGSTVMKILRYTGTQVGSIVANNGSTSFNTSSDRRLKEKITKTLDGAGEVLDQLRPCRFTFVDPKDPFAFGPNVAGFIADELQEVVPDAVSGLAGEVDNNRESPNFGQPIYQQVDTTKLIPYLTQAIKDLQARVTSIEKRLPREPGPREFKEL